jgi:hypothetical protein
LGLLAAWRDECLVFVFDFDGVLAVNNERGEVVARPAGTEAIREALSLGVVYILTGRRRAERGLIMSLLAREGVNVARVSIVARGARDRRSEVDYKSSSLLEILNAEGCVGEVHDDNPYVLEAVRRHVSRGGVLHHERGCEPLYGSTILAACRSSLES